MDSARRGFEQRKMSRIPDLGCQGSLNALMAEIARDVSALFVHLREGEVVFDAELREHLSLEHIRQLPYECTEQHAEVPFVRYLDPVAPSRLHGGGAGRSGGVSEEVPSVVAFLGSSEKMRK